MGVGVRPQWYKGGHKARPSGRGDDSTGLMSRKPRAPETKVPFVDPRTGPDPRAPRPRARFAAEAADLEELHRLCRDGRLYDVERWIQAGRPLQVAEVAQYRRRPVRTALQIALERQDHSLVLLLVANGYDLAGEPRCPLDAALHVRRRDLIDLLLDWGADPLQADLDVLCETYDSELYERFLALGVDFTRGHALAYALGYHTSNKPLFGFAKRHRLDAPGVQRELDMALQCHAGEGNEKGVMLCLWAGADAHARVPYLEYLGLLGDDEDEEEWESAVYRACSRGHAGILERLGPDPRLDDYEELYLRVANEEVVEVLARLALPEDHSRVVLVQLSRLSWHFGNSRPVETLRALFAAGVRWHSSPIEEIGEARRHLLRIEDWKFPGLMKLLATDDYCSDEILTELARTPAIRERMRGHGLIPESSRHRSRFDRSRPARARETLGRLGVQVPKPTRVALPLPPTVRIGARGGGGAGAPARAFGALRARVDGAGRHAGERVGPVGARAGEGLPPAPDPGTSARLLGQGSGGPAGASAEAACATCWAGGEGGHPGAGGAGGGVAFAPLLRTSAEGAWQFLLGGKLMARTGSSTDLRRGSVGYSTRGCRGPPRPPLLAPPGARWRGRQRFHRGARLLWGPGSNRPRGGEWSAPWLRDQVRPRHSAAAGSSAPHLQ